MMKHSFILFMLVCVNLFSQNKDVELLKSQNGNEIIYYAKNNLRETVTVEVNVEGNGFSTSIPMPASIELRSYEKKEAVKLTLAADASYSVSYKYYKGKTAPKTSNKNSSENMSVNPEELNKGIVVFSKDGCGKCNFVKNNLTNKSKTFKDLNISTNSEHEQLMWKKLQDAGFKGGSVQTPVVMIDGKVFYNMDLSAFLAEIK